MDLGRNGGGVERANGRVDIVLQSKDYVMYDRSEDCRVSQTELQKSNGSEGEGVTCRHKARGRGELRDDNKICDRARR